MKLDRSLVVQNSSSDSSEEFDFKVENGFFSEPDKPNLDEHQQVEPEGDEFSENFSKMLK